MLFCCVFFLGGEVYDTPCSVVKRLLCEDRLWGDSCCQSWLGLLWCPADLRAENWTWLSARMYYGNISRVFIGPCT
jgi:hypothetical protein